MDGMKSSIMTAWSLGVLHSELLKYGCAVIYMGDGVLSYVHSREKKDWEALLGYKMDCNGIHYKCDKERVRNKVWENQETNGLPDTLFLITAISGIITVSWLKRNRRMISCIIWSWFSVMENMIIRPKVKLPIVIIRCKSALNIFGWNGGTEGKIPA